MKDKVEFYCCGVCGNLVELINKGGGQLVCCGKPMVKLEPNTNDASQEKHVPVAVRKDGKITVEVGSVIHPMTEEHFIEWIALVSDEGVERVHLSPEDDPEAEFNDVKDGSVYAYCNLHGLWKADL